MTNMRQKVARALRDNLKHQVDGQNIEGMHPSDWAATGTTIDLEHMAKAAIEAMMEPSEGMYQIVYDPELKAPIVSQNDVGNIWKAMIRAALEGE